MAKVLVELTFLEGGLTEICSAIRAKTGGTGNLSFPTEMKNAVASIETGSGGITPTGKKEITANGDNIDVTSFASVKVAVPEGIPTDMKTYVTAQASSGTSLSYSDNSFDGSNVVGCWIQTATAYAEENRIHGMLVLPTSVSGANGMRVITLYKDSIGTIHASESSGATTGFSFTVGAHSMAVTVPSGNTEKFFTGTNYRIYPILGEEASA